MATTQGLLRELGMRWGIGFVGMEVEVNTCSHPTSQLQGTLPRNPQDHSVRGIYSLIEDFHCFLHSSKYSAPVSSLPLQQITSWNLSSFLPLPISSGLHRSYHSNLLSLRFCFIPASNFSMHSLGTHSPLLPV